MPKTGSASLRCSNSPSLVRSTTRCTGLSSKTVWFAAALTCMRNSPKCRDDSSKLYNRIAAKNNVPSGLCETFSATLSCDSSGCVFQRLAHSRGCGRRGLRDVRLWWVAESSPQENRTTQRVGTSCKSWCLRMLQLFWPGTCHCSEPLRQARTQGFCFSFRHRLFAARIIFWTQTQAHFAMLHSGLHLMHGRA